MRITIQRTVRLVVPTAVTETYDIPEGVEVATLACGGQYVRAGSILGKERWCDFAVAANEGLITRVSQKK